MVERLLLAGASIALSLLEKCTVRRPTASLSVITSAINVDAHLEDAEFDHLLIVVCTCGDVSSAYFVWRSSYAQGAWDENCSRTVLEMKLFCSANHVLYTILRIPNGSADQCQA